MNSTSLALVDSDAHDLVWRLRQALDAEFVLGRLRQQTQHSASVIELPEKLVVRRLHSRGAHGFVVEYGAALTAEGGSASTILFGEVSTICAKERMQRAIRRIKKSIAIVDGNVDVAGQFALLEDVGLIVRLLGLDERIDGLRWLWRPDNVANVTAVGRTPPMLISHRLGKRAVLRYACSDHDNNSAGTFIAKLYNKHSKNWKLSSQITDLLRSTTLAPGQDTSVPSSIGRVEGERAYLMECAEGTTLSDLALENSLPGHHLAGKAIARMHDTVRLPAVPTYGIENELKLLRQWIDLILAVRPHFRTKFEAAWNNVLKRTANLPLSLPRLIHRDFHEKQILYGSGMVHLIDFDTASLGDPAIDIGNFLAHAEFAGLHGRFDAGAQCEAFVAGYREVRSIPKPDTIDAYRLATLLRIACIHLFNDGYSLTVPKLVERIAEG